MDQLWRELSVWLALALAASLVSVRLGLSVALAEILVGIAAGNTIHPAVTPWVSFLASFGALVLTFLAGAELETEVLRRHWRASLAIGFASFLLPFLVCWLGALFLLRWEPRAAQIAGIAMSTTSVAVVYAVMLETGLNEKPLGKLILAACFVTDLGTVVALGLLFTSFDRWFWGFLAVLAVALPALRRLGPVFFARVRAHVSEPHAKLVYLVLAALALLAVKAGSEGVLPAYLVGMVMADTILAERPLVTRMRAAAFTLLTPFYFLKAGSLVDLRAVLASGALVLFFVSLKVAAKFTGVAPVAALFRLRPRVNAYTTLMMSTGLTFGSISALYGYTHGFIDRMQYSVLLTAVLLTAVVPTMIAQRFFLPAGDDAVVPGGPETGVQPEKEDDHVPDYSARV